MLINFTSREPRSCNIASFVAMDTPSGPGVNSFLSGTLEKERYRKIMCIFYFVGKG